MSTQELHPFTGHYLVHYTHPATAGENLQMLTELLERIARSCAAAGATIIGHIKAFATQPGGGYLTASVTSAKIPAQVDASALQTCEQLEVCLVVLVYGLDAERLVRIVTQTWQEMTGEGLLLAAQQLPAQHLTHASKEQFK
jgi:hypothetical protein